MTPRIEWAHQLSPGVQITGEYNYLLPSQGGGVVFSNVDAEGSFQQIPNPRPSRLLFGGIRDPRLRMIQAIPLDVSVEESTFVVSWPEVNEFGTGETMSAALSDFAGALIELYYRLSEPDVKLSGDLRNVKEILGHYIQRRDERS